MNLLAKAIHLTVAVTAAVTFVSSAGATPLSAGSLPMIDAAAPTFETVQWRGWGGWRGGWGGWGWGGGLAATGLIVGSALASAPYYGYYSPYYGSPYYDSPYYDSPYYYPPTSYSYYAPAYYGGYGYSPYGLYDSVPSRHDGRHGLIRRH